MGLSSRTRRILFALGLAWPVCLSGLPACTPAVSVRPAPSQNAAIAPAPAQLSDLIARRDRRLGVFRGEAHIEYQSPTQHFRSSQIIAVRAPSSIRIDVMNPFGVSYTVATDGRRLAAFDRRKKVYYEGWAGADNIREYTGVPLSAADLAMLVRGVPPSFGAAARGGRIQRTETGWLWSRNLPRGGVIELWVDFANWDPVRLRVSDGVHDMDATFGDYQDLNGLNFPRHMEVSFIDGGKLELSYHKMSRKLELAADAFRIQRPEQVTFVDMDKQKGTGG